MLSTHKITKTSISIKKAFFFHFNTTGILFLSIIFHAVNFPVYQFSINYDPRQSVALAMFVYGISHLFLPIND